MLWASSNFDNRTVDNFYGFAQTAETEINSNYALEIQEILVEPGQVVSKGQVLMHVKRARPKETLPDQDFRIAELRAEERLTLQRIDTKLASLQSEFVEDEKRILDEKERLQGERSYRKQLLDALSPEERDRVSSFDPNAERLNQLDQQLSLLRKTLEEQLTLLNKERQLAQKPYQAASDRLVAERNFDEAQLEIAFDIVAPSDGVIGSINAKLAEHKSSFAPLLSFYEPNPTQVKAYIHEDRILTASVGDTVFVQSILSDTTLLKGVITGMGSRIIEIPARLRRLPDFQIFGREVIIAIPKNNPFLQNEKVGLGFSNKEDE